MCPIQNIEQVKMNPSGTSLKSGRSYVVQRIFSTDQQVMQRLHDLGLYSGISITVLNIVSFSSVYVLQFGDSIVALNETEMSCLIL
jgi:Fe2+ transport system protein FeoA